MSVAFWSAMPESAIRSRRVGFRSPQGTISSTVTGRTTSVRRSISRTVLAVRLTPLPRPIAWISSPSQMLQRTASAIGSIWASMASGTVRPSASRTRRSTMGYHQPAATGFDAGTQPVSAMDRSSTVRGAGRVRPSTMMPPMPPQRSRPLSALK